MRRFENTEGSASKFWEIAVEGQALTTRWGRIGSDGQVKSKTFEDPGAAQAAADAAIREKLGKGYVEIGGEPAAPRPAAKGEPAFDDTRRRQVTLTLEKRHDEVRVTLDGPALSIQSRTLPHDERRQTARPVSELFAEVDAWCAKGWKLTVPFKDRCVEEVAGWDDPAALLQLGKLLKRKKGELIVEAARAGALATLDQLIDKKVKGDVLQEALTAGIAHPAIVALLAARGASLTGPGMAKVAVERGDVSMLRAIAATGKLGETEAMSVAAEKHHDLVPALLDLGVSATAPCPWKAPLVLMCGAYRLAPGFEVAFRRLLKEGARVTSEALEAAFSQSRNPEDNRRILALLREVGAALRDVKLWQAAQADGSGEDASVMFDALVAAGVRPTAEDVEWVSRERPVKILARLRDLGAEMTLLDVMRASTSEEDPAALALVARLIAEGVSLDEQNGDGNTALHGAVRRCNVAAVRLLLERGARRDLPDNEGKLPADLAAELAKLQWKHADEVSALLGPPARLLDPVRPAPGFEPDAVTLLLVGRTVEVTGDAEGLLAFFDQATALCGDGRFRVVPVADFTRFAKEVVEEGERSDRWFIGLEVASSCHDEPSAPFSINDLRAVEKAAGELLDAAFWERLEALEGASDLSGPRTALVTCGQLPSGTLAFGRQIDLEEDEGTPKGVIRGQDLNQERQASGIEGVRVARCDQWSVEDIDVTAEHAERARSRPEAAYHLVSSFD